MALAVFATRAGEPVRGRSGTDRPRRSPPAFLDPVWQIAHDALVVWALSVTLVAIARRQWGLVRDLAVTVVGVVCVAAVVDGGPSARGPTWRTGCSARTRSSTNFVVGLALWVAIGSVASSHGCPYRYLGRWIAIAGGSAAVALKRHHSERSARCDRTRSRSCSCRASVLRVTRGLPSLSQTQAALAGIGVQAEPFDVTRRSGARVPALATRPAPSST